MPYSATVYVNKGSIQPVYATVNAPQPGGTITLQAGGTFTLYQAVYDNTTQESSTVIVSGFNAVTVSGYNTGALSSASIWYVLNTASLNTENIPSSGYVGIFTFQGIGSDGITRTFNVDIQIQVDPPVEIPATYDPTQLANSPLWTTRLWATDTDVSHATFTDDEVNAFLAMSGGVPTLAAAMMLDANATNRAKLSNTVKIGSFGAGEVTVYKALLERAAWLRSISISTPIVISPDPVFVPDYLAQGGWQGTMDPW